MNEQQQWQLGQTSSWYETHGKGVDAISSGRRDKGGVSYGAYQLASKTGTVREYLDQSNFKADFEGLEPGSIAFSAKWAEIASGPDRDDFAGEQHDFIKRTHYDVQVRRLKQAGMDLTDRGAAVQDALWSTSVQYRNGTRTIFEKGLQEKFGEDYDLSRLSDQDIVEAAQDYKYRTVEKYFADYPDQFEHQRDRCTQEKADLVQLAKSGITVDAVARAEDPHASPAASQASNGYEWSCPVRLDDSSHPDQGLYLQARSLVYQLDRHIGRTPDLRSDQLASALTVSARAAGMQRIDQVALSEDASALWGAQRPTGIRDHFFDQHCKLDTVQAMNTPMEQSGAQWPQAMRQFEQGQEQRQQQTPQVPQQEQPTQPQTGPAPTM